MASANEEEIAILEHESPKTMYLVDSDNAGEKIRNKLIRAGIPEEHIFKLPDDIEQELVIEDYINSEIYLNAINEELKRSHGEHFSIKSEELPIINKPRKVTEWCESKGIDSPNKRAVAYHILDYKSDNPDKSIIEEKYKQSLQQLYFDIGKALNEAKIKS